MHHLISPECYAAFELSCRNDGYLMAVDDPVLSLLLRANLVTARQSGDDGYLIVKAIPAPSVRVYPDAGGRHRISNRWVKSATASEGVST